MERVIGALWTKSSSKSRKLESSHLKFEVIVMHDAQTAGVIVFPRSLHSLFDTLNFESLI